MSARPILTGAGHGARRDPRHASTTCCCTPARPSSGRACPGRCAARSSARCCSRGWPRTRPGRGDGRARRGGLCALPRAQHRRADGGRHLGLDAGLRGRELTHGNRAFSNLNEGYGKVLRYGAYSPKCSKAALDERCARGRCWPRRWRPARRPGPARACWPRRCTWATRATTATRPARCCTSSGWRRSSPR